MSCKVEKIGTNKAKFIIEIDNAEFLKAEDKRCLDNYTPKMRTASPSLLL